MYDYHFLECINDFVQVMYNSESIISCIFLNRFDASEKTCCVKHHLCDQHGSENVQECSNDFPYDIKLNIYGGSGQTVHCYTVSASNSTYTMRVDGTFTTLSGKIIVF